MSDPKTSQTDNVVGGDIAGGNIHKSTHIHGVNPNRTLRELAQRLSLESAEDEQLGEFIEALKPLTERLSVTPLRGLEKKLQDANRTDLIPAAVIAKEAFSKKLNKNLFSQQVQEFFVHVLSRIYLFFVHRVRPLLNSDADRSEIDTLIHDELVVEIYNEIGACELDITPLDLFGMLYFLTGNCHIDWD